LQLSTGTRFCEVSALEWQDIDFRAGKLRIVRSQVVGVVGPPKTEVTRRDVFLAPVVVGERSVAPRERRHGHAGDDRPREMTRL
jgi:integrase